MNDRSTLISWWSALAVMVVCGPWPGWSTPWWMVLIVAAAALVIARPQGRAWWGWFAVVLGVGIALWPTSKTVALERLASGLDRHCREMLTTAEGIAADPILIRLLGAGGETLDPSLPFSILERSVQSDIGRTAYLSDDRNQVVGWGGAENSFPYGVRPLGQRQWGIAWSAGGADLWVREPLLVDGKLIGAITVSDHSPISAKHVWGMQVPGNLNLRLGWHQPKAYTVIPASVPGVELPVLVTNSETGNRSRYLWLGWFLLVISAIILEPRVAWAVVAVGSGSMVLAEGAASDVDVALWLLLGGAAAGRLAFTSSNRWSRFIVILGIAAAATGAIFGTSTIRFSWLPDHLLQAGWGGIWMVALAWLVAGWPSANNYPPSLGRRLQVAACLAGLGLVLYLVRLPLELERWGRHSREVELPYSDFRIDDLLPDALEKCQLDDFAPVFAKRWGLAEWSTPSELQLLNEAGEELSRWGDISPAGGKFKVARWWPGGEFGGNRLELLVATEPWSLLSDWKTSVAAEEAREGPVWIAVLTRSGAVAASLHPEIRDLDAIIAGELFHRGGGWTRITVGESRRLARVRLQDQHLVAAVTPHSSTSDWVVRTAVALLWALLGSLIARPPVIRREHLKTFGGRLQLLVAGGVVVPLAILTLFLHQRISGEEYRLEQVLGLDALKAAGYTAVHLGGSFAVDDPLARWLAAGWGGEVTLWDGTQPVAASRPDLMVEGKLPQLPAAAAYPSFLLNRDDPIVFRWRDRVVAAGPVELQGRRLLLHLYRYDPLRSGTALGAVDWLLTGALLSALLALVLTARVEQRLSVSLRELVSLSRKLLEGQPAGSFRRPQETDLAEVLDVVRTMNEEVQQRELSLRHQEELLRITLSTLAPAVVVLDPGGAVRYTNPSAQQLQELHGALMLEKVKDTAGNDWAAETITETIQPIPGRELTWRIGAAGVPFPDGELGLVAVIDDVTDLVQADRLRQLNQMARIVAHEVKNPLTPVRLWVQELEDAQRRGDSEIDSLLKEACREIAIQVARLEETANSFSNLVALEHWEPEPVDFAELLPEVPSGIGILERRGIVVACEISEPLPPPVMGDRQWFRRALTNLVQNCVDALTDTGGEILLRLYSDDSRVVIEVEDSGGGVPEDGLAELFAPHFSTTASGSGLGLALVHQVVTRCQGRVVASNSELGLNVRLDFPAASPLLG